MRKDSTHNLRLAPALARGKRQSEAPARRQVRPAPPCTLDELPDFSQQVEAAQEQARARRSQQEQRAEIERATLRSALTPRPASYPTSVPEQPSSHQRRHIVCDNTRAWSALVRHAETMTEPEDETADPQHGD